jgi:hypothetical protein
LIITNVSYYFFFFFSNSNTVLFAGIFIVVLVNLTESGPVALRNAGDWDSVPSIGTHLVRKRSPTVNERPGCKQGAIPSPNRVNTT